VYGGGGLFLRRIDRLKTCARARRLGHRYGVLLASALTGLFSFACQSPLRLEPEQGAQDVNEIVICGERFAVEAPVVLWFEEGGYSAYRTAPHFSEEGPRGLRYRSGRSPSSVGPGMTGDRSSWEVEDLAATVDLFVLHYDVCGTAERCFQVLQDIRMLSVHFLLDIDGTLYQTLDLADQAWHARQANPRSVGVEIAQIGAWPPDDSAILDEWYVADDGGKRIELPARLGDGGLRTPGFVGRPVRSERIRGRINGTTLEQHDFTPEQYASLEALAATLARALPRIAVVAPRDEAGAILPRVLEDAEFEAFSGILGHWHVTASKTDPGPAFDWEGFLARTRALLEGVADS